MLRNKEDLARDRDTSDQQLDFTKKIDKEKNVETSRRLVSVMLLFTVGLSLVFWLTRSLSSFSLDFKAILSPFISLFSKNYIPSGQKPNLDQTLGQLLDQESGTWAFYVHLLDDTNFSWFKNENLPLTAASLIKLPVVLAYYYQVDQATINPDTTYRLERQDLRSGAGSLQYQKIGHLNSYRDLAHLCLNQSDNTAYAALLRIITPLRVKEFIAFLNLPSTDLEKNTTSASDVAKIFQYIYNSSALSDSSRQEIISSLTDTAFEDRFPVGLPQGIQIAHKIGTEATAISDAGLIFTPDKNFILILLADQVNPSSAQSIFPKFAQTTYWQLLNR